MEDEKRYWELHDKLGAEVTKLKIDVHPDGTIELSEKEIAMGADGKFYIKSNHIALFDTEIAQLVDIFIADPDLELTRVDRVYEVHKELEIKIEKLLDEALTSLHKVEKADETT